jgi:hypothetical protein
VSARVPRVRPRCRPPPRRWGGTFRRNTLPRGVPLARPASESEGQAERYAGSFTSVKTWPETWAGRLCGRP